MNYIYDITINFQKNLYDFFEWNVSDNIFRLRKIPLFRVKEELIRDLNTFKLVLDYKILEMIRNKTELFSNNKKIEYACIFSGGNDAIGCKLSDKGEIIAKTKFLIDEDIEINEIAKKIDIIMIDYKIIGSEELNFKTRNERAISNYIFKKINYLKGEKIKYLYFDLFGNDTNMNDKEIKLFIKKELSINFDRYFQSCLDFLKLILNK